MGLDNSTTDPSRDTVTVTNPNSSCSLRKSRDEPHLPSPSLGKTVLLVWAVGLGTWIVTLDVAPSLGLSTNTLWVDGKVGPQQLDQTQDKANGVRAVHELGPGSRREKFCLQTGAHPAPCSAPAPCHQPDLMPVCSLAEKTRNSKPQFHQTGYRKDPDLWICVKNVF